RKLELTRSPSGATDGPFICARRVEQVNDLVTPVEHVESAIVTESQAMPADPVEKARRTSLDPRHSRDGPRQGSPGPVRLDDRHTGRVTRSGPDRPVGCAATRKREAESERNDGGREASAASGGPATVSSHVH